MVHRYRSSRHGRRYGLLNDSTTGTLTWNDEGHDRRQADWPATYPPVDDFWSVDCPSSPPTCRAMPASFGAVRPQISSIDPCNFRGASCGRPRQITLPSIRADACCWPLRFGAFAFQPFGDRRPFPPWLAARPLEEVLIRTEQTGLDFCAERAPRPAKTLRDLSGGEVFRLDPVVDNVIRSIFTLRTVHSLFHGVIVDPKMVASQRRNAATRRLPGSFVRAFHVLDTDVRQDPTGATSARNCSLSRRGP